MSAKIMEFKRTVSVIHNATQLALNEWDINEITFSFPLNCLPKSFSPWLWTESSP